MKLRTNRIISFILTISVILGCMPTSFAEKAMPDALSPLQGGLSETIELTENDIAERVVPEKQELLDIVNNNPGVTVNPENGVNEPAVADSETMLMSSEPLTAADGVSDEFRTNPVNSVFNVLNNNNDYVSEATGALTYEKSILSLLS